MTETVDKGRPEDTPRSGSSDALPRSRQARLTVLLLIALFLVTRVAVATLAIRDDIYQGDTHVVGDVFLYDGWTSQIEMGARAYDDLHIEYPPGSVATMLVPEVFSGTPDAYLVFFVLFASLLDTVAFTILLVAARRVGSFLAPIFWVVFIPALGAISYTRLDIFVGVLSLVMLMALMRRHSLAAGLALGLGAAMKLYPIAFVPTVALRSRRWILALLGVAVGVVVPVLLFIDQASSMWDAVFGYHTERAIQVESTWGLLAILTSDAVPGYSFGAFHVATVGEDLFKAIGSGAILIAGAIQLIPLWRRDPSAERTEATDLARYPLAGLLVMVSLSTVFSPQYLLWIAPLAAVYLLEPQAPIGRTLAVTLVGAAAVTQVAYPFRYGDLLAGETGLTLVLLVRNLALITLGLELIAIARRPVDP